MKTLSASKMTALRVNDYLSGETIKQNSLLIEHISADNRLLAARDGLY